MECHECAWVGLDHELASHQANWHVCPICGLHVPRPGQHIFDKHLGKKIRNTNYRKGDHMWVRKCWCGLVFDDQRFVMTHMIDSGGILTHLAECGLVGVA